MIEMNATGSRILDHMALLSDATRCRAMLALAHQELTVSELCSVLQLPQSTVSRHLKVLADDGWVAAHRDGTSRLYSATPNPADPSAGRLWQLVREQVSAGPAADEDERRMQEILAQRRTRTQEFFSSSAGQWAQLRRELFGERFDLLALLGLLDDSWTVGDLGAGTGLLAKSLAPFVRRLIAVDESEAMLDAAAARINGAPNVELRRGRLEELPIEDGELDAATLILVLHHVARPEAVLAEAARALRPGGKLLIVDMLPHGRQDFRLEMGHVWLGFSEEGLQEHLAKAGLEGLHFRPLSPDPSAKGPSLFSAVARKAASPSEDPERTTHSN